MTNAYISCNKRFVLTHLLPMLCLVLIMSHYVKSQAIDPLQSSGHATQPAPANKQKSPPAALPAITSDPRFNQHAHGNFDVKITPLALFDKTAPPSLGRREMEKHYHGEFEGTSKGEMLTTKTSTDGSEAYVALEYVTGALKGHKGTFVLLHKGLMTHGKPDLVLMVVPDSGTGELVGIDGTFKIEIAGGKHFYDFAYKLSDAKK
jgi:hypothetical protein